MAKWSREVIGLFGNNRPHTAGGFRQIRIRSGQHEAAVFAAGESPHCNIRLLLTRAGDGEFTEKC